MILAFLLCLFQGNKTDAPEARVDFYSVSNAGADVELEVEAEAYPLAKAGEAPAAKPSKVTRMLTWQAGGSDNAELARLVAEALAKAGLDSTSDGAETIVRNAVSLHIKTNHWDALGAQVWVCAPKAKIPPEMTLTFDAKGNVGKGACVVAASSKSAGPKPPEGDDIALAKFPAGAEDANKKDSGGKEKPAQPATGQKPPPKPTDPKATDPKAKNTKPIDVRAGVPMGAAPATVLAHALDLATAAGWKATQSTPGSLRIETAPDGAAPKWAAIRYVGKGDARIGVRVVNKAEAPQAK
jgi:hypothetical protein